MRGHLALYGNISIPRQFCFSCRRHAFVLNNIFQCCDKTVEGLEIRKIKRFSLPPAHRVGPSKKEQKRLLGLYGYKCAYCEQGFGWWVRYHSEKKKLRITWDHNIPWAFSQDNSKENFMPCCQFCNGWKNSFMFQTLIETKIYMMNKWEEEKRVPLEVK